MAFRNDPFEADLERLGPGSAWDEDSPPLRWARHNSASKQAKPLGLMSAAALMAKDLPPIGYIVPGYVAEGLTLLGGKAKLGKSWLLFGVAIAVATGGVALNSVPVEQGDVLALFLEDNERRLQKRLAQLLPTGAPPERLAIDTDCPRLDDGLLDLLRGWIERVARPRLIIIDVLNRVRPKQRGQEGIYDYDVRSLEGLQGLAAAYGLAIVVVHHTRKAEAEDPFDCLSGSTGLTGTADTTLVLARGSQGVTLYGRGRDVEEIESALSFDRTTGHWSLLGEASEVHRSDERNAVLITLAQSPVPMSPQDVAEMTGGKRENLKKMMSLMASAGEIVSLGPRKGYLHPDRQTPSNPGYHGYRVTRDGDV